MLGTGSPGGPLLLDTNVFINSLTGRGPPNLQALLVDLPQSFVSSATVAELSWARGRLDPEHPQTSKVLATIDETLARVDPAKILTPTAVQWRLAGERAGKAVRSLAGGMRSFKIAAERHEMLNDALTAVVASDAGVVIVTQDADFDILAQIDPALGVLFYS